MNKIENYYVYNQLYVFTYLFERKKNYFSQLSLYCCQLKAHES